MSDFRILFKLRDVERIEPWRGAEGSSLHWFGLSDGTYCIDTPAGRLLQWTGGSGAPEFDEPWCEYQVARLFEDLATIWPAVSDPVPEDVPARYFAWRARTATTPLETLDPGVQEKWDAASFWWHERLLDFPYLRPPPELHLLRIGSEIHLHWSAALPWAVATTRFTMPFDTVQEGVARFFRDFLAAMRERVSSIELQGWRRDDCSVDVKRLVAEQSEREEEAAAALARVRETDWDEIRRNLSDLGA